MLALVGGVILHSWEMPGSLYRRSGAQHHPGWAITFGLLVAAGLVSPFPRICLLPAREFGSLTMRMRASTRWLILPV